MADHEHPTAAGWWMRRRLAVGVATLVALGAVAGRLVFRVLRAPSERAVVSLGGPSASVAAGGLQLTLATDAQTTYQVKGDPRPSYCFSALWAEQSGGQSPTFQWPTFPLQHCAIP